MYSERSPIFGMLSNPSMMDFPGCLSAVLFTTGCNFRCGFCHNAPLLGVRKQGYTWEELEKACRRLKKNWVKGVVITGGEPTLWENLGETLEFFRVRGFRVKLDSNGSRPDALKTVLPLVDYVAMDVKCRIERYPDFVSFSDVAAIRSSISLIMKEAPAYEFRTTVIEDVHDEDEIRAIGESIRGAELYALQAFIPRDDLPDETLRNKPRTRPQILESLGKTAGEYVRKVTLRGN